MEMILIVLAALAIAGSVVLWHVYGARVKASIKVGPIQRTEKSLSELTDEYHIAKSKFESVATQLHTRLSATANDVKAASDKVVSSAQGEVKP